jgi:hypothetical protein
MNSKYEELFVNIDELRQSFNVDLFIQTAFDISGLSLDDYNKIMVDGGWQPNDYQIMQNTHLSDIQFEINDNNIFKIKNKQTNDFVVFSNRIPSAGEMRGINLRNNLLKKMLTSPKNITLYQALIDIIQDPANSDMFTYLLGTFSGIPGFTKITGGATPYFEYFKRELLKFAVNCIKERENGLSQELIKQNTQRDFDILLGEFTQANYAIRELSNNSNKNLLQRNKKEVTGTLASSLVGVGVGIPLAVTGTCVPFGVGLIGTSLTSLVGWGAGLVAGGSIFGSKIAYNEHNLKRQREYLNKFKSSEPSFVEKYLNDKSLEPRVANETTQGMKPSA